MESIAAQIRALIDANAPGLHETIKMLPDVALVAAGPVALLLVLILLFMILGALGGGKKKKAARAAALAQTDDEDDLPRPARVQRPPPPPPPAPPPATARRANALLDAVRNARAKDAEPASAEERAAQEEASVRVLKESPAASKMLIDGNLEGGFEALAQEAAALEAKKSPRAAQAWRDLGMLAEGVDPGRAIHALEAAFYADKSDFWGAVFLSRMRIAAGREAFATETAMAAASAAKGPREKAIALIELGDATFSVGDFEHGREAYENAIEVTRSLARGGEHAAQRDLSICLNKLGDLETKAGNTERARKLLEEDLTIARHLAAADRHSDEAQRDLIISLAKLGALTDDKRHWVEARDAADALQRAGRLPPSDAPLLEALRKRAAA